MASRIAVKIHSSRIPDKDVHLSLLRTDTVAELRFRSLNILRDASGEFEFANLYLHRLAAVLVEGEASLEATLGSLLASVKRSGVETLASTWALVKFIKDVPLRDELVAAIEERLAELGQTTQQIAETRAWAEKGKRVRTPSDALAHAERVLAGKPIGE